MEQDQPTLLDYIIEMADERYEELMSQGIEVNYGDCVEWACQQDGDCDAYGNPDNGGWEHWQEELSGYLAPHIPFDDIQF